MIDSGLNIAAFGTIGRVRIGEETVGRSDPIYIFTFRLFPSHQQVGIILPIVAQKQNVAHQWQLTGG